MGHNHFGHSHSHDGHDHDHHHHHECPIGNEYDGLMAVRISSVFVVLITSLLAACFPVWAARRRGANGTSWPYFIAKYFGSGVILSTAFIHLLTPAYEALGHECLTGPISDYDWVPAICLMTIFVLFVVELMAMRYAILDPTAPQSHPPPAASTQEYGVDKSGNVDVSTVGKSTYVRGEDHLGHARNHTENAHGPTDHFAAQMTAIFILEFGVVFHSIFVGLTLAVSGSDEFPTLYAVIVFHQAFEGLGLGARLASTPWPANKRWTPYILGIAYGLSTPIAIGIGLAVRQTYSPGSETSLMTNGIFDSISAGILIYTGLVELMAHEFMFSETMRTAPMKTVLAALGWMALGAALMSILGNWA